MLTVGDLLPEFQVIGVKPHFNEPEEGGISAFEPISHLSFPGSWKVMYFYPKDFTSVCPTEITKFSQLQSEFAERGAILLAGNTDNEHCKLAWRRDHQDLHALNHWQFADSNRQLADALGIYSSASGCVLRATFIVDPYNIIQHVSVNNTKVARNPIETLRLLDAIQTEWQDASVASNHR